MTEAIELTLSQSWLRQMDGHAEQTTTSRFLDKPKRGDNQWEKMLEEQVRGLMAKPEQWNKDEFSASAVLKDSYVHNSRHVIKCSRQVSSRAAPGHRLFLALFLCHHHRALLT